MKLVDEMKAEPWRFDFFQCCAGSSAAIPDRPRIGDSAARRDEYVELGQDPYHGFPGLESGASSTISGRPAADPGQISRACSGPQGALPLATTEESLGWWLMRDDAFPRFLDLFNTASCNLFFRAWADARPIAQHDRPAEDRFIAYVGSIDRRSARMSSPISTRFPTWQAQLRRTDRAAGRNRASRLTRLPAGPVRRQGRDRRVRRHLARIRSKPTAAALGGTHARLGSDAAARRQRVQRRRTRSGFGSSSRNGPVRAVPADRAPQPVEPLADAVFFYIGDELEWEVELAIPAGAVVPVRLGQMRPAWLDQLDFAELDLDRRISPRCALSTRRATEGPQKQRS